MSQPNFDRLQQVPKEADLDAESEHSEADAERNIENAVENHTPAG